MRNKFENEYEDLKENSSNSNEENELKKNIIYNVDNIEIIFNEEENINQNLIKQYNKFKIILYEKMKKKQYKYVVNQIDMNLNNYKNLYEIDVLKFLKIESLLKIIIHKIKKYYIQPKKRNNNFLNNSLSMRHKLKRRTSFSIPLKKPFAKNSKTTTNINYLTKYFISIESYYNRVNFELNDLIRNINYISEKNKVIYIEKIIQIYIKLCLTKEYQNLIENKIPINFYFLSLSKKLIDNFIVYMIEPKTLKISEKVLFKIIKLFIKNRDFENVEKYCYKIIKCCIKECFLIYQEDFDDMKNIYDKNTENVIFNLCIAIFYLGICKENEGKNKNAIKYYSLIESIYKNLLFKSQKFFKFFDLIILIKNRNEEYLETIKYLTEQNEIIIDERIKKEIEKENQIKEKKIKENPFLILSPKMKKIEELINKIKIPKEVNLDYQFIPNQNFNKSSSETNISYKNYILSNLRLLNDYSSDDFKEIINSMEKIKIIDLDYLMKGKVQRLLEKKNHQIYEYQNKKYQKNCSNKNNKIYPSYLRKSLKKNASQFLFRNKYENLENILNKNKPNISSFNSYNNYFSNYNSYSNSTNTSFFTNILSPKNIKKKNSSCPNLLNENKSYKKNNNNKTFIINNNLLDKKKIKVEKFKVNKKSFEYSNSFKNKKIYIDGLRERETSFLKKLLQMKKDEKSFEINDFNLMKIKKEATKKFNYIKENVKLNPENLKEILNKLLDKKKNFNKEKTNKNTNFEKINERKSINNIKKKERNFSFNNTKLSNEHNKKIIDYINYEISDLIKEKKEKLNELKEIKFGMNNNKHYKQNKYFKNI